MNVQTDQRVCDGCGHRAETRPRRLVAVRQWLRLSIPAARCPEESDLDVSGWGTPCDCQNPCHGS